MFTVIKLGGCNGSGKTTLARAVMDLAGVQPCTVLLPSGKWTKVYLAKYEGHHLVVLGKYDTACGGMDTISDKNDRLWLLDVYCKRGNIVFYEGLITGKTYGAMGELSEKHVRSKKGIWLYTFMDTSFDDCVSRVLQRREAKGNDSPFDPERTMRPTYRGIENLRNRVNTDNLHEMFVVSGSATPKVSARALLKRAASIQEKPQWPK